MSGTPKGHLYLVDGSSYLFRAYHALPPLTRDDGTPVNAVYGFTTMLYKLLEDTKGLEHPSHFAVIFDAGAKTFRNELYPKYKINRPPPPEDLIPQFPLVRDAVRAFNVPTIERPGYEADDIIATYAKKAREAGLLVTIVSSDKDLMQLVGGGVEMLDTMKNKHIGPAEVVEKFGVPPEKVIDVQALAGDSIDNIPGAPGIGVKTAAQLIEEYGDLDTLLARAGEIKQPKRREALLENAELIRLSRQLVALKDDVPLDDGLDDLQVQDIAPEPLLAFLNVQGFKSLRAKFLARLGNAAPATAEGPAAELAPDETTYETVSDLKRLASWINQATVAGVVAVDTETTSLDAVKAELVGVSLSIEAGKACYIPVGHRANPGGELALGGEDDVRQLDRNDVLRALKPLLADPAVLKVGQNIKYDLLVLAKYGITIAPYDDTMLISYVLDSGKHGHGMDELSELHLGHSTIKYKDVAGSGASQLTFDRVPIDQATAYAAEDADITGRLYRVLKPRLVAERLTTVYETLERPMPAVLAEMEGAGIRVDRDCLRHLSNDFAGRMADLEDEIYKLAGRRFNVNSPKQLGEILFDEMSLKGGKKGKTGAYATHADVLEALAAEGHDLPARVLDYRQLAKLKSTYTDALQAQINDATGRVHTSYALASTSTGRLSSTDPNLQNIPIRTEEGRKIRRAFIANEGCKLLAADYSQIELRLFAHMADIGALREAFAQGLDIHAMTASQVFGVPMQGMDPALRRQAKAINFGIIYGISAFGLARQLGVPQREAQAYIDSYFARFPGIGDYMERTKALCRKHGFVETLFGRRCHVTGINDKNPSIRGFAERAAINAPIQGTAADIIRRAMIRMGPALAAKSLNARMLLQVHDELVFEVPEKEIEATTAVVREVMSGAALPVVEISVPLTVDVGIGDNWDEAH
ncbi:MAG: DNA polymerase I [Sphingomonadales bacterium]|nr:DNA polymerase I [Sphingomonadales bacterium]